MDKLICSKQGFAKPIGYSCVQQALDLSEQVFVAFALLADKNMPVRRFCFQRRFINSANSAEMFRSHGTPSTPVRI